jgi:hypothetical protein
MTSIGEVGTGTKMSDNPTKLLLPTKCDISRLAVAMTTIDQQNERFDFRAFMVKHQYKVMFISVCAGLTCLGIYHLLFASCSFRA